MSQLDSTLTQNHHLITCKWSEVFLETPYSSPFPSRTHWVSSHIYPLCINHYPSRGIFCNTLGNKVFRIGLWRILCCPNNWLQFHPLELNPDNKGLSGQLENKGVLGVLGITRCTFKWAWCLETRETGAKAQSSVLSWVRQISQSSGFLSVKHLPLLGMRWSKQRSGSGRCSINGSSDQN